MSILSLRPLRWLAPMTLALGGCSISIVSGATDTDTEGASGTEGGEAGSATTTTNGDGDTGDGDGTTTGDGDGTSTGDGDGTSTGDGDGTSTGDGDGTTGDGDGTTSGDGDGTTGDGDGTTTGDGDGTTTGDGDGTTTGDGDGCTEGTMGCPCFPNDTCFAPLVCSGGVCGDGDGDGTTGDGDGTTGDGDGTTGDGDMCGNGVADAGEECDGQDLRGQDCSDLGFVEPQGLACTAACALDPGGCAAFCGNGVAEPGEQCDDGNDVPDDGCDQCVTTGGTLCGNAIVVDLDPGSVRISGTTVGGGSHQSGDCQGEGQSDDRTFDVMPNADGFVTVWLDPVGTNYDAILYSLADCLDPDSGGFCSDLPGVAGEVIGFPVQSGQTYSVVVDGVNGDEGDFEAWFDLSQGDCGDPVPVPVWASGDRRLGGLTIGQNNDETTLTCGGDPSPDVVYQLTGGFDGAVDAGLVDAATTYDSVISVRTTCVDGSSELSCDTGAGDDIVSFSIVNGGRRFVVVDGAAGQEGEYVLVVSG